MKNWKELKKQFWAKLIAMLLAIVSGFVFVVTAAATVLYGTVSELQANQNTVEKDIDIQLLENYATHLFAEGVTGSDGLEEAEFDGLDGGHIAYTVVKKISFSTPMMLRWTQIRAWYIANLIRIQDMCSVVRKIRFLVCCWDLIIYMMILPGRWQVWTILFIIRKMVCSMQMQTEITSL